MKFSDRPVANGDERSLRRLDFILAGAGHLIVLALAFITFSSGAATPSDSGGAIMVEMYTMARENAELAQPEVEDVQPEIEETQPEVEDVQPEVEETQPEVEDVQPEVEETQPEVEDVQPEVEETQPEVEEVQPEVEETQPEVEETQSFSSVTGSGQPGSGSPGPGTYESRVFNAVRREYRTSVQPARSYRLVLTVNTDGTVEVEVVRKSGTSAFDRAVENALASASIPPMPPGRSEPAVINIEFLGPEQ